MKTIAFKRAKHCQFGGKSLHPDFITEFADTCKFDPGFHNPEDGWEILDEDKFNELFAKNEQLHQEFLDKKRQLELAEFKALETASQLEHSEEKQWLIEFEEFKTYKQAEKLKPKLDPRQERALKLQKMKDKQEFEEFQRWKEEHQKRGK